MKTLPLFLMQAARRVVILGGRERVARKARPTPKSEVEIAVVDEALDPEFRDALAPLIVDREPLLVKIGAEGAAPVLARQVEPTGEPVFEPRLGGFVALAGRLRDELAARSAPERRRAFWASVLTGTPRRARARGTRREAACPLEDTDAGGATGAAGGFVSLVGAGPGARDLITLRGVRRLQEADVIFYDRLVDPDLLELARRDAERIFVGKSPGVTSWPQDRINGVILAAARAGKRVVRLKCGDPGIFARGAEEGAACDGAGIAWEFVPGVTAACAAAAEIGSFLTERGVYDSVVLATGATRPGDPDPDWASLVRPGTTLALYMAVAAAPRISAALIAGGAPGASTVEIVADAGTPRILSWRTSLADLACTVASERIANPAIVIVRLPKAQTAGLRAA